MHRPPQLPPGPQADQRAQSAVALARGEDVPRVAHHLDGIGQFVAPELGGHHRPQFARHAADVGCSGIEGLPEVRPQHPPTPEVAPDAAAVGQGQEVHVPALAAERRVARNGGRGHTCNDRHAVENAEVTPEQTGAENAVGRVDSPVGTAHEAVFADEIESHGSGRIGLPPNR